MTDQERVTLAVSVSARTRTRGYGLGEVLDDLAERAVAIAGVAGAGVSLLESGRCNFVAASDGRAAVLGQVQEEGQAGPSVAASLAGEVVTVSSLTEAPVPWRVYQRAALDAGIGAIAAVPMTHNGERVGAVELCDASPRDWSAADLLVTGALADLATAFLVQARELERQHRVNQQLREALDSRILIEQAKGVLAAERRISVDEAFLVLRRHARGHSVSLRSVAAAVVGLGLRP